jgi:hypothetical protein
MSPGNSLHQKIFNAPTTRRSERPIANHKSQIIDDPMAG